MARFLRSLSGILIALSIGRSFWNPPAAAKHTFAVADLADKDREGDVPPPATPPQAGLQSPPSTSGSKSSPPSSDRGTITSTSNTSTSTVSPAGTTRSPGGADRSPGKRTLEEEEAEAEAEGSSAVDFNKIPAVTTTTTPPPSGAVAVAAGAAAAAGCGEMPSSPDSASDRRVRPRTVIGAPACTNTAAGAASAFGDACLNQDEGTGGEAASVDTNHSVGPSASEGAAAAKAAAAAAAEYATMLAIAKDSAITTAAATRGKRDETDIGGCREDDGETEGSKTPNEDHAHARAHGGGAAALVQEVRSLARRFRKARPTLSPEQLEEVDAMLQQMIQG